MEVYIMTEKSKNTNNNTLKMVLLTAALAIPALTILIIRFMSNSLGETSGMRFAIMLLAEISADMFSALAVMSYYYLYKFISGNTTYTKYSTKSNITYSTIMIVIVVMCYILKLLFYIFETGEINISSYFTLVFLPCLLQLSLFSIVLSDDNLYIGTIWQTYSIDKIKLENINENEKAISKHEEYQDLKFHYDDKEVKTRITRKEMAELREIMKGVRK
jgi:hypothetical protein